MNKEKLSIDRETKLIKRDNVKNIPIYMQGEDETETYKYIKDTLDNRYNTYKQDVEKLQKYINHPLRINIVRKIETDVGKISGLTKPEKNLFTRKIKQYHITVQVDDIDILAHEMCHVIDNCGTKQAHSNQENFEPFVKIYKQEHKKIIHHIKTNSDLPENEKIRLLNYWEHPYRKGDMKTELFARFCHNHLQQEENLSIRQQPANKEDFDILCEVIYNRHMVEFKQYFSEILTPTNENSEKQETYLDEQDVYEFKTELSKLTNNECAL